MRKFFNNLNDKEKAGIKSIAFVVCFIVVALFLWCSLYTVQSGTRKLVFSAGKLTSVSDEGLHLRLPIYQKVMTVPVTTQKVTEKAHAASSDLQVVGAVISVNYHFPPDRLAEIYEQTHFAVEDRVIKPRIQETLKAVSAKHTAEDLIVNRAVAKQEIDIMLKSSLSDYHIVVEDVLLTDFQFSPEFDKAIEAKQTEAQNTQKARNILERTKIESEQRIVQAKAEAEAIRIQVEAIRSQGGVEYVQLKWIEKWNGMPPSVVSGEGASNFMLGLK